VSSPKVQTLRRARKQAGSRDDREHDRTAYISAYIFGEELVKMNVSPYESVLRG
jgi:hypothetical protein